MPYTTIAVHPETKRLMSEYCKANPGITSYDDMINRLINPSRNAGRVAESAETASDIFDLFIQEFPAFWGTFETKFFESVPHEKLQKYLERAGARARRVPKSKREARKAYARYKGPTLEEFQVRTKTRRSPKGKRLVQKGSRGRRRSRTRGS